MNNDSFYKHMYEAAREDLKDANDAFCNYILSDLEGKLGNFYYLFLDYIVVKELKEVIISLEEDKDVFETPDNKATELNSAYRMLYYFSPPTEYKAWVEGRRVKNETD